MEDTFSRTSQDSAADCEFVVVTTEPKLHITGNGGASELERNMTEVLNDDSCTTVNSSSPDMAATDKIPSEPLGDEPTTSEEVQQVDEMTVVDSNNAEHRAESGNSFNNLNTSTLTMAGAGKY